MALSLDVMERLYHGTSPVKVRVKVTWICIASSREHTSKALRYGTRFQGISQFGSPPQFYLHTPRSSANGMNHTCLCHPSPSWYSFTAPGGMEGWVSLYWSTCTSEGTLQWSRCINE